MGDIPHPITVDLETEGISSRPDYPPSPVGVAVKVWGRPSHYWSWDHPTGNDPDGYRRGRDAVADALRCPDGVLFHNAKFDLDVIETRLGLPRPPWDKVHDTLLLLFLDDPRREELSLKPSAEYLLGEPPTERDEVASWLLDHQPLASSGVKISQSKSSEHYWGRYICLAPGGLVGRYARGDVDRTEAIFGLLWPLTRSRGMLEAYDRERRLMPILLGCERDGVPIHVDRLAGDVASLTSWRDRMTGWITRRVGAGPSLNLDSGQQLVDALLRRGLVDPAILGVTPRSGRPRSDKVSLEAAVSDRQLSAALRWRTQLGTCLGTFMEPWLKVAASDGRIFTTWNQVRGADGGGTRTGRLSSSPNFQNIPKSFRPSFAELSDVADPTLPRSPLRGLPRLPVVRSYVAPWRNHVLADRDWSQQEPRLLAHFDGGVLMEQYRADPWLDFHDNARDRLAVMGLVYERRPVKIVNLGLIYGQGVGLLAQNTGLSVDEAGRLKRAILSMYPGLKAMYGDMRARAARDEPIRTWGGRLYYCEPPRFARGRMMSFDYKLVNVLIQGSAADQTKEAMIRWAETAPDEHRLLLNVHDELVVSAPRRDLARAQEVMRTAMEEVPGLDVPMLTEGAYGDDWADLKDYDRKGVLVYEASRDRRMG